MTILLPATRDASTILLIVAIINPSNFQARGCSSQKSGRDGSHAECGDLLFSLFNCQIFLLQFQLAVLR